ncbi:MarR family winged helix-turn-helix transcriptional regulator [Marinicrinis sediminis]|uniref:MarR family winged helix-turn-helix transcriptional regulator n=1 Tax=Marinicrinis sediminis TaxID=1652465 RepID=A0ABW5REB6_9BACL
MRERDRSPSIEQSLKSFIVLSRAFRHVSDRVREDIQKHGLNPTEFAVLELLYHKGEQPIQKIGDKILLTSGSMTYVINRLAEKALIERVPCEKDRRITFARISAGGSELMQHIFPSHEQAIDDLFSVWTDEEKEQFIMLTKRLGIGAQHHR